MDWLGRLNSYTDLSNFPVSASCHPWFILCCFFRSEEFRRYCMVLTVMSARFSCYVCIEDGRPGSTVAWTAIAASY
jgi:hypothetical protein